MSPFALISHLLWLISFEIKMGGGSNFSIAASATLWNIPWHYELNPVSSLGGDEVTSFFSNENKTDLLITDLQKDGQTY